MVKIPVYLNNMTDAKHLVQIAEKCENDVDLVSGRYVVDGKSMLGVFSLPQFDNVELCVDEKEKDRSEGKEQTAGEAADLIKELGLLGTGSKFKSEIQ